MRLLPVARTVDEKQRLLAHVRDEGGEGIVLKDRAAPYEPGVRSKRNLKVKFRKTVDCIVTARNEGRQSNAHLAVYEDGALRPIGKCSMIGKPDAQVGDVVEVAYLYATESLTLYQPSLARLRPDKDAVDCTLDQLRPVSKAVIESLS